VKRAKITAETKMEKVAELWLAEIEQAVIAGLYYAFGEQTELRHAHVLKAVEEAFPLSATMGEEISRLREWSKNRTRPASAAQRLAVAG